MPFTNLFKSLLFLSLYLPFALALNPSASLDLSSIRVLILLLFFIWFAQGLKNKKLLVKNNLQTGLIIAFLFLNLLSLFFARNTDWSERKLLYLFSIFPIYFVISSLINSSIKTEKLVKGLVFSGAMVAALGIFQFILQFFISLPEAVKFWSYIASPFLGQNLSRAVLENSSWLVNISGSTYLRATATFPDPHMFSLYLGLLLPLSLSLGIVYRNKLWITASVLIFIADILTFSRGGYLGLAGGALVLFLISWKRIKKNYKITVFLLALSISAILIIPSPISSRFFSSFNLKEGSNLGRIEMWKKAFQATADHPLFGVGIGNFPLEVNPRATYRDPIYAHNTYLDIAAETGILSGLVWIGLLITSWLKLIKKAREKNIYLLASLSLVIFSIHSLVETGIYSPVVLTLFLIIISLDNIKIENAIPYKKTT